MFRKRYALPQKGNVACAIVVGMTRVSTMATSERISVPDPHVQAPVTRLGGVGRIHQYECHAFSPCLVFNKTAKLVETPAMVPLALRLAHCSPGADTRQILKRHGKAVVLSEPDDASADGMVNPGHKPLLPAGQPSQEASRPLCAFPLESSSYCLVPDSDGINLGPTETLTCREGGQVLDAEIHTERPLRLLRCGRLRVEGNLKVVAAIFPLDQLGTCGAFPCEQGALVVADGEVESLSPTEQRQAHSPILFPKTENALIVVRTRRMKDWLTMLRLEYSRYASDSPNGEIARKTESFPQFSVDHALEPDLIGRTRLLSNVPDHIASICEGPQRRIHRWAQRRRDFNLTTYRQYLDHGEDNILYSGSLKTYVRALNRSAIPAFPLSFSGVVA